jgi:homoserine dehydrogenase
MQYAEVMDSVIKLIAISRRQGDRIFTRVSPAIVSRDNPLSNVEDVFNGIVVSGDAIGDAMFYGRGAGKLPTASAVVADIIDIVRHNESVRNVWERKDYDNTVPFGESETRYFVRVAVRNREEAAKYVEKVFGRIEFIKTGKKEHENELAFTTERETENGLSSHMEALHGVGSVKEVLNIIRILED